MNMSFSSSGLNLLKTLENFSARVYLDSANRPTCAYGHCITPFDNIIKGDTITLEKGDDLLNQDTTKVVEYINKLVTNNLNQNQFDALVIFTYNVGVSAFAGSTLLKLVNQDNMDDAANEFLKWDKVHNAQGMFIELAGLRNRRLAEQNLFLTQEVISS